MALVYFPLPSWGPKERSEEVLEKSATGAPGHPASKEIGTVVAMEREALPPHEQRDKRCNNPLSRCDHADGSTLALSVALASLALVIRPTTLPFWAYLGFEHLLGVSSKGVSAAFIVLITSAAAL